MMHDATTRRIFSRQRPPRGCAALGNLAGAAEKPADTSRSSTTTKDGLRRLGKTELMVSEVALGGHGGSTWEDRVPVLDRAVELGMNYLDTNIGDECPVREGHGEGHPRKRDRGTLASPTGR